MNATPIGDWLRRERAARALSLRDVSAATGNTVATLVAIEKERKDFRIRTVIHLLVIFGERRATLIALYGETDQAGASIPDWAGTPSSLKSLGAFIRDTRQAMGLSPEALSQRAGYMTQGVIARIEAAEVHDWTIRKTLSLGRALGITNQLLAMLWDIYSPQISTQPLPVKQPTRQPKSADEATHHFSKWLMRERNRRGLSLEAFQKISGVNSAALSRIEGEKLRLSLSISVKILKGFGYGKDEFLRLFGAGGAVAMEEQAGLSLQEIGSFVKSTRLAQGMTQEGLAQAIHISWMTLLRLENGISRNIKVTNALEIGRRLGIQDRLLSMLWDALVVEEPGQG